MHNFLELSIRADAHTQAHRKPYFLSHHTYILPIFGPTRIAHALYFLSLRCLHAGLGLDLVSL